eukprot:NODE_944_length_547_cov_1107.454762_g934_i0.p1 GENE.NODE_944_length_547_cov_1107.454762_g934_i0~~NODE_944_length_547_cov_1107.454762_g934_i0.p1  ORF type:complete len:84 (+),score=22.33 NODE_944_length_547_cov_1107.454762_g934_i0:144-395(+)
MATAPKLSKASCVTVVVDLENPASDVPTFVIEKLKEARKSVDSEEKMKEMVQKYGSSPDVKAIGNLLKAAGTNAGEKDHRRDS